MKKVIISVSNDLTTDQRVNKTCLALQKWGCEVLLVGCIRNEIIPIDRLFKTHRFSPLFKHGPFFYAELNIRLFFFIILNKADFVVSNDLDTLLANYLASRIKNIPIVYDSHELFTEVPELANRKFVKSIWNRIEKLIFPKLICNIMSLC